MSSATQKLTLLGAAIAVLLIGGGIVGWYVLKAEPAPEPTPVAKKRKVSTPVNAIPVSERPYVRIIPGADGRRLSISVEQLAKPANEVEYELEYQTGSLLQGAFDAFPLQDLPATKEILLGSCSAGGACTYHTEIVGGTLLLRFSGTQDYAVKSDWSYLENAARLPELTSKDEKFALKSTDITGQRALIIYNTPGVPAGFTGTLASDAYALGSISNLSGDGQVRIEVGSPDATTVLGWDGSTWHSFPGTLTENILTTEVTLMQLYVAASP